MNCFLAAVFSGFGSGGFPKRGPGREYIRGHRVEGESRASFAMGPCPCRRMALMAESPARTPSATGSVAPVRTACPRFRMSCEAEPMVSPTSHSMCAGSQPETPFIVGAVDAQRPLGAERHDEMPAREQALNRGIGAQFIRQVHGRALP